MRTNEIKNEVDEVKKQEDKNKQINFKHETNKHIYIYDFQQFEMIRSLADNIHIGKISIDEAEMHQSNLLENMV